MTDIGSPCGCYKSNVGVGPEERQQRSPFYEIRVAAKLTFSVESRNKQCTMLLVCNIVLDWC